MNNDHLFMPVKRFEQLKARMASLPDLEWREGHAPAPRTQIGVDQDEATTDPDPGYRG